MGRGTQSEYNVQVGTLARKGSPMVPRPGKFSESDFVKKLEGVRELMLKHKTKLIHKQTSPGAAGDYWEQAVGSSLKQIFGENNVLTNAEYVDRIFRENQHVEDFEERCKYLGNPVQRSLLLSENRKKAARCWKPSKTFMKANDDTADWIIMTADEPIIIDIKSRNISKSSREPNLISAQKISKAISIAHKTKNAEMPNIWYLSVDWMPGSGQDESYCEEMHVRNLLKINPAQFTFNFHNKSIQAHLHKTRESPQFNPKRWGEDFQRLYRKSLRELEIFVKQQKSASFIRENESGIEENDSLYRTSSAG